MRPLPGIPALQQQASATIDHSSGLTSDGYGFPQMLIQ
jgi:hypothetical protein